MKQDRKFKGVWIPKEIWLDDTLSLQEKVFLVEIDSLDNDEEKGCFASNEYFGGFFDLSTDRTSKIISGLKDKGFLEVDVQKNTGKSCRKLRVTHSAFSTSGGRRKQLVGVVENAECSINNIDSNKNEEDFSLPSGVIKGSDYTPDHNPAKRKAGKRTQTEAQRDAFNAMRSITYYREKADAAGMDYLKIDDESANKRFQKQAKDFEKRYRANWKEVIDWWFEGEGDWANFHPSNFFNISTYMKFDNKDSKAKKGGVKHYA